MSVTVGHDQIGLASAATAWLIPARTNRPDFSVLTTEPGRTDSTELRSDAIVGMATATHVSMPDSIIETLEILNDPELVAEIAEGKADIARGDVVELAEFRRLISGLPH